MAYRKIPTKRKPITEYASLVKDVLEKETQRTGQKKQTLNEISERFLAWKNSKEGNKRGTQIDENAKGESVSDLEWMLRFYLSTVGDNWKTEIGLREDEIEKWLVYWLSAKLEYLKESQNSGYKSPLPELFLEQGINATEHLKKLLVEREIIATRGNIRPTLERFPIGFSPLVIITGTAHTYPPQRIEDLFRHNALFSDLTYVGRLNLDPKVLILSDRVVIRLSEKQRKELLGKKFILTIGGPSVNIVTREICKQSIFSFEFHERHKMFDGIFNYLKGEGLLAGVTEKCQARLTSSGHVNMLWEFLNESPHISSDHSSFAQRRVPQKERRELKLLAQLLRERAGNKDATYKEIMELFIPLARFDPVKLRRRRPPLGEEDFAMISIAPNPWNTDEQGNQQYDYLSIAVAGFHDLGTAYGLKALSIPDYFKSHPLGGFLKVSKGQEDTEYARLIEGGFDWEPELLTPAYTVKELKEKITVMQKNKPYAEIASAIRRRFTDNNEAVLSPAFDHYCNFLKSFAD